MRSHFRPYLKMQTNLLKSVRTSMSALHRLKVKKNREWVKKGQVYSTIIATTIATSLTHSILKSTFATLFSVIFQLFNLFSNLLHVLSLELQNFIISLLHSQITSLAYNKSENSTQDSLSHSQISKN